MLFTEELTTTITLYLPNSPRQEIEHKFKKLIHEDLKLGSVVSYVGNKTVPFLRFYRYKEAFAFVMAFLRRFETNSDDYVFDPFSGLGTTLYTSLISGIPSAGIDNLPTAYFTSKTLPLLLPLRKRTEANLDSSETQNTKMCANGCSVRCSRNRPTIAFDTNNLASFET
jgi:hypothetical protein